MTTRGVGKSKGVSFRHDEVPVMEVPETEIQAGIEAMRAVLVQAGYSSWVSDEQVRAMVVKILEAALAVRAG